jgi:arginase
VLGGDCSVLLGPALALRRLGRYALVHVDGHNDFGHEGNNGTPYATIAGADLAVVTGRGPETLTNIGGLKPYFRDEDVIQLGEKSDPVASDYWPKDFLLTAVRRLPLSEVRRSGIDRSLDAIYADLALMPVSGFWLHLDLDVLDPQFMPAVDSPDPGGFTWEELDTTLQCLLAHPQLCGLNIGIFDPDLDPNGRYARKIAASLRPHLQRLAARPPR